MVHKIKVYDRYFGEVLFMAEVEEKPSTRSEELGLAVLWALENGVSLHKANLSGANLVGADLSEADLSGANLSEANLFTAAKFSKIRGINTAIARTRILPEGSIIGWKKCRDGVLVKLRIPEEAKRSHAFGRKCRAEFADVLEVIGAEEARSSWNPSTVYKVGERVYPDSFDENWTEECAPGIHFFITREEAEAYL